MADRERRRTYDAEHIVRAISAAGGPVELYGTTVQWPVELRFGELDHVQAYVADVMAREWFTRAYPHAAKVPVRVRHRKGDRFAHYDAAFREIAVNAPSNKVGWGMREIVVLHELAHHVISLEDFEGEPHGSWFRGVFVHLVREALGAEAGWILQMTYIDAGLRVEQISPVHSAGNVI